MGVTRVQALLVVVILLDVAALDTVRGYAAHAGRLPARGIEARRIAAGAGCHEATGTEKDPPTSTRNFLSCRPAPQSVASGWAKG
jgi:hypothetical protein